MLIKYYINFLYGVLVSDDKIIRINTGAEIIVSYLKDILTLVYTKFGYFIPYIDTDEIYVYKGYIILDEIIKIIKNKTNIEFIIENGIEGTFIAKKRIILKHNEKTIVRGFRLSLK